MMVSNDLAGKRVLFIAPRFFGYDDDIAAEIARRGAIVERLHDRPYDTPMMTAVTKIAPTTVGRAALKHYRSILQSPPFDIVFVVNGQTIPRILLDDLRRHSPRATFTLYLWDALRNRASIIPNLDRFDQVFSFDRDDAVTYGFRYRPTFYVPGKEDVLTESCSFDISFIGTAHTDRAPIVDAIDRQLPPGVNRFWYLFLQAPWVYYYYAAKSRDFRRISAKRFSFSPIGKAKVRLVLLQSRAVLDIEHPLQRGLTMRTFDSLILGKKLVTTNPHIVEEEIYHPDNVVVIDRSRPVIDPEFLRAPFTPISPAIRQRYTVSGWLDEILSVGMQGAAGAADEWRDESSFKQ